MGFWSKLFGSNTTAVPQAIEPVMPKPEIKESDFIDTTDPNEEPVKDSVRTITINWGTGHPIDDIYAYIRTDWEANGYDDACKNPDKSYQDVKVNLILNGLQHAIDLTRLKYDEKIRNLNTARVNAEAFGLVGSISQIDTEIATCNSHLEKIKAIEDGMSTDDSELTSMVKSYKRGFSLGVKDHINKVVNSGKKEQQ